MVTVLTCCADSLTCGCCCCGDCCNCCCCAEADCAGEASTACEATRPGYKFYLIVSHLRLPHLHPSGQNAGGSLECNYSDPAQCRTASSCCAHSR